MPTILVVEDNLQNMKLARFILEEGGYTVLEGHSADEGIEMAKQIIPDLILMDVQLPGKDGLSAINELRNEKATSKIKIIALTALAMQGDKDKILAAGADGYLSKPYHYKDLLSNVKYVLEEVR